MDNRFGVSEEDFIEEGQDYRRTNLGDGDLSDRIVVQSTRNDDPAIWFEKEHPDFQYLYQVNYYIFGMTSTIGMDKCTPFFAKTIFYLIFLNIPNYKWNFLSKK